MEVNYAPSAPPGPKAVPGGVCALVQEGRAGQLVLAIHPRHPGMALPFRDRAAIEWDSCISFGVWHAAAQEQNTRYPSEHPDTPVLMPASRRVVPFGVVGTTPDILLQQGSSSLWSCHELMLVPEARAGTYTLSGTLA